MPDTPETVAPAWARTAGPVTGSAAPRPARRFLLAAVVAGLTGLLTGMLTWLRPAPDPYFVPFWITQYSSPIFPPAPAAEADRLAIQTGKYFGRGPDTYASQESTLLLRELQSLGTVPAGEQVVVYLNGYVAPAAGGDVVLFPADADPSRDLNALQLSEVIRRVAACPARQKLLVLDLTEPAGDVRAGVVRADVAVRLPASLAKAAPGDETLLVLTACGPGQVAQTMPAEGRTAFGYYFEQALGGAARPYHDADHPDDRRVSVREAAQFLLTRVDRWAQENRGVRQTPFLLGSGRDFDLTAPPNRFVRASPAAATTDPAKPPATPGAMPGWLLDGWTELERWRTDATISEFPRLYQRLQSAVLRADRAAPGPSADRAEAELRFARTRIDGELLAAKASVPRPTRPTSLAMAQSFGERPDPALDKDAAQLLADIRAVPPGKPEDVQAATAKLVAGFAKAAAGKSAFAVETAVFTAAVDVSEGRPDMLAALVQVLKARNAAPGSSECRFLVRLAELGARVPPDQWPAELVRVSLQAVRDAERVAARPDLYPWAGRLMEVCTEARWEGESLLAYWGDVPAEELNSRFRRAEAMAGELLSFADAARDARRAADVALAGLVTSAAPLDRYPERETFWVERVAATTELIAGLTPPAGGLAEADLLPRGDELRRRTERVRQLAVSLSGGTPAELQGWLTARAARGDAGPDALTGIEAVLALPSLPVAQRVSLRAAAAGLAGRLDGVTKTADDRDDASVAAVPPTPLTPAEVGEDRAAQARRAGVRARCGIELLRLAGVSAERLDKMGKALATATRDGPDSPAWDELAGGLRDAWGDGLRDAAATADRARLDLLSALFPGDEPSARLDDPPGGPRVAQAAAAAPAYLGWLAARYRYLALIGLDAAVYENALADLGPASRDPVLTGEIRNEGQAIPLSAARPIGEIRFVLVRPAADPALPTARALMPDGSWLRATVAITDLPPDPATPDLRPSAAVVRVEAIGVRPPSAVPAGVVIEFALKGRAVFVRIPIDYGPAAPPVDVVLSRSADPPADVGDSVRLRPSDAGQPLLVFVRNQSPAPRPVTVRLSGPFPTTEAKVTAPPGGTVPVQFPAAPSTPPAAAGPAVSLPNTVRLELVDGGKSAEVLRDRTVRVDIADPIEYVEATAAVFEPAAPPDLPANRLRFTFQARRELGPPPCVAELVLDPADIPGFKGVTAGRLRGTVPPDRKPLGLEASGLSLDPEAAEDGAVSVTVDGVENALRFRVDFARFGDPTTPVLDTSARLRLRPEPPPVPGQSLRFRVGGDFAPLGSRIDVRLLRIDPGGAVVVEREQGFPAARSRHAAFAVAAGGVTVQPALRDWEVSWDTPQLIGRRTLQARLLGADGRVLLTEDKPVVLDTTPPAGVMLQGLPPKAKRGDPLPVSAAGSDPESGIASVKFFLGKPVNNQPPPGVALATGTPVAGSPGVWSATLTMPGQGESAAVGVVFENNAGLVASDTGTVELVNELPILPGAISGTLVESDRPQSGLDVTLYDANAKAVKTVKSGADGSFRFDGLTPGAYTVFAQKTATRRTVRLPVKVEAGKTATVTAKLQL